MQTNNIRLHLPAIPYTITRDEYSHDAFTGKVKRFSPMMRSRGFEVIHYGVETSDSGANIDIELFTKEEWTKLRIETLMWLEPTLTLEMAIQKHNDETMIPANLSNWSSPLSIEFNKRFLLKLKENYRNKQTDIVCVALGRTYEDALKHIDCVRIETGIGYSDSYLDYRIFESNSWLSKTIGSENNRDPPNYWFVIPNFYDTNEFKLTLTPNPIRIGFLGRLGSGKGCFIISEIAKNFPDIEFVLCGAGDPSPFLQTPNIVYKPPIHGKDRSDYLGSCVAVLCPSAYLEPFCGVGVEAQLCGTPVISSDYGAFTETVENFKTGLRCHTLADYCHGIKMALNGKFDRNYIRNRAQNLYDMYNLASKYEYVFKSVLDIYAPGKNGWYGPDTYIDLIEPPQTSITEEKQTGPHIYIFLVYYGTLPNYFQLYLDSLEINTDIMTVFFVSDIELTNYNVPKNLIHVKMPLQSVKIRASNLIHETYNVSVNPDELITTMYKLVDFKIVYPLLFDDILKQYNVSDQDYVGWGDCDLIYGKLSNFIKFTEKFEIIGGWHGHLAAIRNTESFKNNFKNIPNYLELITDNSKTHITDEIAYRGPLIDYLERNKFNMFYANKYMCDVIPECFFHMFRPNYQSCSKNFFDTYNADKNISYLYFDKNNRTLSVKYDTEDNQKEVLYCHLQKRKMEQKFSSYKNGYYINIDNFSTNTIKKHAVKLPKCFEKIKSLKEKLYTPDVILDIGACKGIWTEDCVKIYPNANYYLFEALNYSELEKFGTKPNMKVYSNTLLNELNTTVNWYEMQNTGDSMFREQTHFFENPKQLIRESITLDTLIKNEQIINDAKNIFIKIDCQGAEIPILKGATSILKKTDFILLEIPFFGQYNEGVPSFLEHIKYMDSIGFIPFEFADDINIKSFNVQVDIIFINKQHSLNKIVKKALLTENFKFTGKKHMTVITYCSGYKYEVFFKFAATLYDTGFSGNLIFVIQTQDIENVKRLKQTFHNVSYYVDDVENSRHCQQKRYYIFQKMFNTLDLETDYVLLCDSRDILFQLNIEDYPIDTSADLFFFEEGLTIGSCPINTDWLKAIEDELKIDIIKNISHNKIICSGTTFGKYNGIKNYVDRMCNIMSNKVHTEYTQTTGFDQGIHNYLIYIEGFPDLNIKFLNNEDRLVNTLQYADHKFMNAKSQLVNKKNEPSFIVHQYDRLPDFMTDRLFLKYKSNAGAPFTVP